MPHTNPERFERQVPLTEADLDRLIAYRRVPLPAGCDQQGRRETRPLPAEACSELGAGADDCNPQAAAIFWSAYIALALIPIVGFIAALV